MLGVAPEAYHLVSEGTLAWSPEYFSEFILNLIIFLIFMQFDIIVDWLSMKIKDNDKIKRYPP